MAEPFSILGDDKFELGIYYALYNWSFLAGIIEHGLGEYCTKNLLDIRQLMDCGQYQFDKYSNKQLLEIFAKELAFTMEGKLISNKNLNQITNQSEISFTFSFWKFLIQLFLRKQIPNFVSCRRRSWNYKIL